MAICCNLVRVAIAAAFFAQSTVSDSGAELVAPPPLPTHSRCRTLCPHCTTPDCKCDDACWPGQSLNTTSDKDCNCFAQLGKEMTMPPAQHDIKTNGKI